jgi:hypothetical protein
MLVAFAFALARVGYHRLNQADLPLGFWPLLLAFAAGLPQLWTLMQHDEERAGLWLLGYGALSGVSVGLGYLGGLLVAIVVGIAQR